MPSARSSGCSLQNIVFLLRETLERALIKGAPRRSPGPFKGWYENMFVSAKARTTELETGGQTKA